MPPKRSKRWVSRMNARSCPPTARPTASMIMPSPPLDADWVEGAFARIEELTYSGDAATLAAAVAELSVERALTVQGG